MPHDILIVAGPTASGKSALAAALAERLGGTVINADSMQVYRDLPILTAQPDTATQARVPHRLFGFVDAAERYSVGAWRARVLVEIAAAERAGRVPILAGGTGLYFKALLEGLAPVPEIPDAVHMAARALRAELGPEGFHRRLASRDPAGAARLAPGDTQRVLRAYAVVTATGRSLMDWQAQPAGGELAAKAVVLLPPRAELYAACDARFLRMMESGAVAEVRALLARNLDPSLPAMKALGVRELAAWLDGMTDRNAAITAAQQATRNYAKRQYTWLKNQLNSNFNFHRKKLNAQFSERLLPEILSFIRP